MGAVLRHYWLPVLLSSELPERDGQPKRVRLLGEDLVAFRATDGRVGLLGAHCPHRRANLAFGRNEEQGLRCAYHGWKFDVTGQCVDMPNEPEESRFKEKIRQVGHQTFERNGVVWAYLGPEDVPPAAPELEVTTVPEDQRYISKRLQECNWMQALEGDLDSSHVSFLHSTLNKNIELQGTPRARSFALVAKDPHPRFETLETPSGLMLAARREADDDHYYWRVTSYVLPFYVIIPQYGDSPIHVNAWVPIDDEHTMTWSMSYRPNRPLTADEMTTFMSGLYAHPQATDYLPPTSEAGSAWRTSANKSNDYLHDYQLQRTKLFFAVKGLWQQDRAIVETMGPILDRSEEHLGSADIGVIQVRRILLSLASALKEHGTLPGGLDPESQRVRSAAMILPKEQSWVEITKERAVAGAGAPYYEPP
jgi:phthalate 4,5-dioxygenase